MKREQKVFASVLVLCAPIAIILTVVQLRRLIIMPFTAPVDRLVEIRNMFGPTDEEKEEKAKRTDSDGDGLSDWEEEHVYQTSAYLVDTDSDGDTDNIEIAKRTDPNCPKDQVCLQTISTGPSTGGASVVDSGAARQDAAFVPDRNPASIRVFLRSQGVPETDLAGYSDQDLLNAYDQSQALFAEGEEVADAPIQAGTSTAVLSVTSTTP